MRRINLFLMTMCTTVLMICYPAIAKEEQNITYVDDDRCTFRLVSTDEDKIWGYTWNVFLENKTNEDLMFSIDEVSVNGAMIDPFWSNEVPAGLKENDEIHWSFTELRKYGIEDISNVDFRLRVRR